MDYKPKAAEIMEWESHPVTKVFAEAMGKEINRLSEERVRADYAFCKTDEEIASKLKKNIHDYNKLVEGSQLGGFIAVNGLMGDDHEKEV